jgi:chromate reductase, NAD(P)H dehydrogenase (quinone)
MQSVLKEPLMIEIIAGTNRPGSNTLKLSRIIEGFYRDLGSPVRILSLEEMPAEIFAPSSYAIKPASFQPLSDRVLQADGLHFVVPEYNGSFPGVLKYFMDMLKFPESFEHRPMAFTGLSAGVWGAFRAVEQFQLICGYRNAYVLPERVWIPGINSCWKKEGEGLIDEGLVERLRTQAGLFIEFVRRNGGSAAK